MEGIHIKLESQSGGIAAQSVISTVDQFNGDNVFIITSHNHCAASRLTSLTSALQPVP